MHTYLIFTKSGIYSIRDWTLTAAVVQFNDHYSDLHIKSAIELDPNEDPKELIESLRDSDPASALKFSKN